MIGPKDEAPEEYYEVKISCDFCDFHETYEGWEPPEFVSGGECPECHHSGIAVEPLE